MILRYQKLGSKSATTFIAHRLLCPGYGYGEGMLGELVKVGACVAEGVGGVLVKVGAWV